MTKKEKLVEWGQILLWVLLILGGLSIIGKHAFSEETKIGGAKSVSEGFYISPLYQITIGGHTDGGIAFGYGEVVSYEGLLAFYKIGADLKWSDPFHIRNADITPAIHGEFGFIFFDSFLPSVKARTGVGRRHYKSNGYQEFKNVFRGEIDFLVGLSGIIHTGEKKSVLTIGSYAGARFEMLGQNWKAIIEPLNITYYF